MPLSSPIVVVPNWLVVRSRLITRLVVVALVSPLVFAVGAPASALTNGRIPAGGVLRITVPEAIGGKTVVGQLTVDRVDAAGYVTAYGCDDDFPFDANGNVGRSDLNYDGAVSPVASNRLIVKADNNGDVCFFTLRAAAIIVDVNAVTFDTGINSFANRRTDTRTGPSPRLAGGGVLRVPVPEAVGGKTVVGQLTVDQAQGAGYVTAYGCDDGLPADLGGVNRSDLNYDSAVTPVASNRLIVKADRDGDVCFFTLRPAALIVDINGISDVGVSSFANHRTDTRTEQNALVAADGELRVNIAEAVGGKTVVGQLTVDRAQGAGFVTAYGCGDGVPRDPDGAVSRSDVNYDGAVSPVASNRLIVKADSNGNVCFYTLRPTALVVDVNATSDVGISSFPNYRIDTRNQILPPGSVTSVSVPIWPQYTPLPALNGVAALTGLPADGTVTSRPIVAVKIDNYGVARPQWSLDQADAVLEENVEGISRFVALFHTRLPDVVGPVRSARIGDIDMLSAMNRPVFAFSGANPGVTDWIGSATRSEVLVDFSALHSPCYSRSPDRPGPHNLLLDPACAIANSPTAGPARSMWKIDAAYTIPTASTADTTFPVAMDGVAVSWTWDAGSLTYLRSQDGLPHVALSGAQISARNVVELSIDYAPSPADARSPNPNTVGGGTAIVHRDGKAILATWSRATAYDPFSFRSVATGQAISLNTGNTFIELERA